VDPIERKLSQKRFWGDQKIDQRTQKKSKNLFLKKKAGDRGREPGGGNLKIKAALWDNILKSSTSKRRQGMTMKKRSEGVRKRKRPPAF